MDMSGPNDGSGDLPDPGEVELEWNSDSHLRGVIDEYMDSFEPGPDDTAGVRERILKIVREDIRRGPATRLTTERGNPFAIADASVRSIVRDAVDAVDGIRARSVEVTSAGEPQGSAAEVSLTVAMRAGVSFTPTAEVVRTKVAEALVSQLGIPATTIDIVAEDVYVD